MTRRCVLYRLQCHSSSWCVSIEKHAQGGVVLEGEEGVSHLAARGASRQAWGRRRTTAGLIQTRRRRHTLTWHIFLYREIYCCTAFLLVVIEAKGVIIIWFFYFIAPRSYKQLSLVCRLFFIQSYRRTVPKDELIRTSTLCIIFL